MQKYQNTTTIQQTSSLNALIFYWNTKYLYFVVFVFWNFVFCSICILSHLYFVAFAFCYICILAICILFFCILSCLYFGIFVFCPVVFCFVWLYFVLFVLWNICILTDYPTKRCVCQYYIRVRMHGDGVHVPLYNSKGQNNIITQQSTSSPYNFLLQCLLLQRL